jgi:hypothetical protein
MTVFNTLKTKKEEGKEVYITWYYPQENPDLLMEGEDFMADADMHISFVPYHLE